MSLIDSIKRKFSTEEVELDVEQALEFYSEQKKSEIQSAREKADRLVEKTGEITSRLDANLKELEDFEDQQGLDVVEDVAENFYRSRKRLVEKFSPSPQVENHRDDLEGFLEEFNDVSRKEAEVMKYVRKRSAGLLEPLESLGSHLEAIDEFLEQNYAVVRRKERLEQLLERRRDNLEEIRNMQDRRENIDIPREKLRDVEDEIDELTSSQEWSEKENLENRIRDLRKQGENTVKTLSTEVSKLERGLKKLVYAVENGELGFKEDLGKLQALIDGQKPENPVPALQEARKVLEREELLGGRQMKKFGATVENLTDYRQRMDRLEQTRNEISDLENELDEMDVETRKNRLEKQRQSVKQEIDEKESELEDLKSEIQRTKRQNQEILQEIEGLLNRILHQEIELEDRD